MSKSQNALKFSLMTGILTGIGSIGLYYLMSNPKEQIQSEEED